MVKHILIVSPEPWNHLFVSKHHYAVELARLGYSVYFLNPPSTGDKICIRRLAEYPGIFIIDYRNLLRGRRLMPSFLVRSIDKIVLRRIEQLTENRIDLIWSFENSRFFDLRFAGSKLKVYHQVDLNQDFNTKIAAKTADICFCTTDFIRLKLLHYNKQVFKIHHGVTDVFFNKVQNHLPGNKITVTSIGNLDIQYLDILLLEKVVNDNPSLLFQFIGSYDPSGLTYDRLKCFSNVLFTGALSSLELSRKVNNSDILLVCYKADEYREQLASPHKMMEYLASGKVVVTTYTDEYKDKRHLLAMADTREQYLALFRNVVDNLQEYNAPCKQQERIAFAREHTYRRQLQKIFKLIEQHVGYRCFG